MCECHGETMFWHTNARRKAGGLWRCRVRFQEARDRYEATAGAKERKIRFDATLPGKERHRRHYYAPEGGWYRKRKYSLATQREQITQQLAALDTEEANLAK